MDKNILIECGIDYNAGVEKFLDETELYESLLLNFLEDNTFDEAKICVTDNDYEGVIRTIHAMKSVTGTLCMNSLYRKCCETVDAVRNGDYPTMRERFGKAYEMYEKIAQGIKDAAKDD